MQSYAGGNGHLKSIFTQPLETNTMGDGVDSNYVAARFGWQFTTLNKNLRDLAAAAIISLIVVSGTHALGVRSDWPGASGELASGAAGQ